MKLRILALSVGLAGIVTASQAQTVVFNNMPNGTYYSGANQSLNEEGEWFQTSKTAPFTLGGFDLNMDTTGSSGSNTYSNLQLEVQVYGTGVSTYSGSSAAEFSNLLYTHTFTFGAETLANGFYYDAAGLLNGGTEIALPTPVTTTDSTGRVGVVFTWLNAGAPTTLLQTAVGIGDTPSVGSNAETDYNLNFGVVGGTGAVLNQNQYLYSGTVPTNLAVELFTGTPAPEPVSMTFLGLGVVGLIARRRNRK